MPGKAVALLIPLAAMLLWSQAPSQRPSPVDEKTTIAVTKGAQLAEALSTVTSTAISPMLGVCILGVYEYFKTPQEQRGMLPAYTSPWFWVPLACLLLLIVLKDTAGGAAPLLKKPLDAIEVLMLNKASLLLIGFPVVFHEVAKMMGVDGIGQLFSLLTDGSVAVVYAQDLTARVHQASRAGLAILLIIGGMIITVTVWLVGHAFDVLVLLSPFPFLDLLLKGLRTAVFALLTAFSLLDARLGAALAVFVILISMLLFGWALRLLVFGAAFSSDLLRTLLFRSYREPEQGEDLRGFTACGIEGAAKRTCGRLHRRADGAMEFRYQPWLFGPSRTIQLDATMGYEVGRGLFYPTLVETRERSSRHRTLLRLLPRYRQSEEKIAVIMGLKGVRDVRFGRGLRAFWQWLKDDENEPQPEGGLS